MYVVWMDVDRLYVSMHVCKSNIFMFVCIYVFLHVCMFVIMLACILGYSFLYAYVHACIHACVYGTSMARGQGLVRQEGKD